MSLEVDASELGRLGADLLTIEPRLIPLIEPIVKKGAQNIKKAMQADANKSRHFKQIAATVTYDVNQVVYGGAAYEAEIGYDKSKGPAAALAGLAIFGSSKPGGATVRNPEEALNDEAPTFETELAALAEKVFW